VASEASTPPHGAALPNRAAAPAPPLTAAGNVRIAAGQYEWALAQLTRGSSEPRVIETLLTCCRLDPANLDYHLAVRAAQKGKRGSGGGGFLKRVRAFASWVRLKLARRSQDHARVLALGEEVLVRDPGDTDTHLAMAVAAQELGAGELAVWLLAQAREYDRSDRAVHRALGRLYESRHDYEQAIACWEAVARELPDDSEATGKLRDLAALRTLQKNRQRQQTENNRSPSAVD
jgi:tetratricopeptide (TPR) repeat protein